MNSKGTSIRRRKAMKNQYKITNEVFNNNIDVLHLGLGARAGTTDITK